MVLRRSGTYSSVSGFFDDFQDSVKKLLSPALVKDIIRLQSQELHEFGEKIKSDVSAGGLGRMPRHFNASTRIGQAVHFTVDPSEATVRFPKSKIQIGYDEVPSMSEPGTSPSEEDFQTFAGRGGLYGNRSFAARKNRGAGGAGYDIIQSIEYGRNPFLRRNPTGYRDIFGQLTYKGFHPLDASIQEEFPKLRERFAASLQLLVDEHVKQAGLE